MTITRIFSVFLISLMLLSCASKKKEDEKILVAEDIYNNSMDNLEHAKYKKAIEGFEELERTYPYSKWAIKAQIMSAYSSYKNEEYTDALITLDKFIGLHPGNKDIEYAYYLKAICYYEQISDVTRDQSYSRYARSTLKEVVARFPDSEYARDAQGKLDLVVDHLAGKEVAVGRFYLKQKKYIAAINRFKEAVVKYPTTSHTPEALHRLVEANMALGLKNEAKKYAAVLGHNFPGSKWYAYSYELIEGKTPDVAPDQDSGRDITKKWTWKGFIKKPFEKLIKQPNLVDNIDKTIPEIGDLENSAKVEPVSDRAVQLESVQKIAEEKNKTSSKKHGFINWLKNIKLPFVDKKYNKEPILESR